MNAGLSNLGILKGELLPVARQGEATYDSIILNLGLGVLGGMEAFCNRKFRRQSDTYIFSADRTVAVVPRYPIESISAVDLQEDLTTGWESQAVNDAVKVWEADTGMVHLYSGLGNAPSQVRLTYVGGYWWSEKEAGEADAQPSGSLALPDALKEAWIIQCRVVWTAMDKLGVTLASTPKSSVTSDQVLAGTDWAPQARRILETYRRFSF